jgi:hypothetical protein
MSNTEGYDAMGQPEMDAGIPTAGPTKEIVRLAQRLVGEGEAANMAATAIAVYVAKVAEISAKLMQRQDLPVPPAISLAISALIQNNAELAGRVPEASAIFRASREQADRPRSAQLPAGS